MLNCATTNEINGGPFPNLDLNIETRLNHFRPINLTTLIKISQKTLKGVEKVCSFNLNDNGPRTTSRDMSGDYFSPKESLFVPNLASFNSFKRLNKQSFYLLSLQIQQIQHVGLLTIEFTATENEGGSEPSPHNLLYVTKTCILYCLLQFQN